MELPLLLVVKLASIVVHAEEALGPKAHAVDLHAIQTLLADPAVVAFLADPAMREYLPVKRR